MPGHESPRAGSTAVLPEMVPRPVRVGGGLSLPLMGKSWGFLFPEPSLNHHLSLLLLASPRKQILHGDLT